MTQFRSSARAAALLAATALSTPALAETTVTASGWDDLGKMMTDVINPQLTPAGVTAEYNAVQGDFQKFLLNALSSGTAPDLFYVDINWAYPVFASGKVAELPEAEFAPVLDAMPEALKAAFYQDGKLYGVAKDYATLTIAYNKDLFEDAGVEVPTDDDTWESLGVKLTAVHQAMGDGFYGTCLPASYDRFGAVAFAYGWQPFDAEGRTTLDANFAAALTFWKGLKDSGAGAVPADIGMDWTGGCLASEKVAIAIEGAWINGFLRDNAPAMEYGAAMLPKGPDGKRGNFIYTVSWSMKSDAADPVAALATMKAMVSEQSQNFRLENYGAIPIDRDLTKFPFLQAEGKANDFVRKSIAGAQDGAVVPFSGGKNGGAWMEVINAVIADVMINNVPVEEAITKGQARLDLLPD